MQWVAVVFNLGFLYFMIRERTVAWPLGIIGSFIMIFLSWDARIYLEAIVYMFYVVLGFYGWYRWSAGPEHIEQTADGVTKTGIVRWTWLAHLRWMIAGFFATGLLGYVFNNFTDAKLSYLDAFSTCFQLIATYLETRKVLSSWLYWIVLNVFAIWFYSRAGLDVVAIVQMTVYSIFSIIGYFSWLKKYRTQIGQ